jgi:hypothetical protein
VQPGAAVLYKETLDRLKAPASAIIISGSNDDEAPLVKPQADKDQRKDLVKRLLKPGDPLSILIVRDMLITGFDAPIEQVMYLDSPLKEHTLLQAIARVNRVCDDNKMSGTHGRHCKKTEAPHFAFPHLRPLRILRGCWFDLEQAAKGAGHRASL